MYFFSSRRRHTRSYGDWSSDVCSSDLGPVQELQDGPETDHDESGDRAHGEKDDDQHRVRGKHQKIAGEHARDGARSAEARQRGRSEEHTSELQSPYDLVCRLLLEKKKS